MEFIDQKQLVDYAVKYGGRVVLALITLVIGFIIIKFAVKMVEKGMRKAELDDTLRSFIKSISSTVLKILLLITVASMLGVEMTTFIAMFGAAGLAVGLALQGSLSNFAGGILVLIFRPFNVGDFIEAQGYMGTVTDIQILYTTLKTVDNKKVVIPNGNLSNNSVVNFSALDTRRVEFIFGVGYEDDIDKVKEVLRRVVSSHEKVLKDPEPFIRMAELADSSVNFKVRVWVNTSDYWDVFFDIQEAVKKAFDSENISIPFPQRDVHLHQV